MLKRQALRSLRGPSRLTPLTQAKPFSSSRRREAEVEIEVGMYIVCYDFEAAWLTILDGKKVSIEAGSALIQACEKAGVTIPRYCYHEKLSMYSND